MQAPVFVLLLLLCVVLAVWGCGHFIGEAIDDFGMGVSDWRTGAAFAAFCFAVAVGCAYCLVFGPPS